MTDEDDGEESEGFADDTFAQEGPSLDPDGNEVTLSDEEAAAEAAAAAAAAAATGMVEGEEDEEEVMEGGEEEEEEDEDEMMHEEGMLYTLSGVLTFCGTNAMQYREISVTTP